ncbi:MAG TPA: hypothetical protein VF801_11235 [Rhodocyclaceae bacterium]
MQYRKSGDVAWKDALAMWYDRRNRECRGSIVQLAPGTGYDVRLGVPGRPPSRQLRASTWPEAFPVARTVTLPPGTSTATLEIAAGGTPAGYVLYTTDPAAQSIIDVADAQPYDVVVSAPYVIVRGLVLKGAQADAIRLDGTVHDVVIEGNDISGWGRDSGAASRFGYRIGVNEDSGIRAVCTGQHLARVVVQRNRIHDPRYGANSWSEGHPSGPQALSFDGCGGNHVIRYNEVWSAPGHYFNDGLGGAENFSTAGFPNADSDIYGNRIENAWDDCIEAEGGDRNVRVWGNYCNDTTTAIASTIVAVGPLYIFRNVYNRSRQLEGVPPDADRRNVFAKSGTLAAFGAGRRYIFHNTVLQAAQPGAGRGLGAAIGISGTGARQPVRNTVSRNNIWQLWRPDAPAIRQAGAGNDFANDLYSGRAGARIVHGIRGTPAYAPGNGWTSESGGRYQQAAGSPGYDRAVRIPNFNDDYAGAAPDIGAAEAGMPPMVFGVEGGRR